MHVLVMEGNILLVKCSEQACIKHRARKTQLSSMREKKYPASQCIRKPRLGRIFEHCWLGIRNRRVFRATEEVEPFNVLNSM